MYIIAAILIFGVLIAVHELGHFLAAKACGVRVNEFSIGMGPTIFHTTKGETEYSLRLLPIGGFCAMEGEDEESDDPRALEKQGFWKKLLIFVAGAAMNFLTGFLIMLCLYAGAQGFYTAEIVELDPAFPQQGENGIMVGDVIWAINGERIYLKSDVSTVLGVVDLDESGTIEMTVKRGGEKLKRTLTLQTYTDENGEAHVESYDKLLIATGSSPKVPPIPGIRQKNIFPLKTLDQAAALKLALESNPKSVVIVGGGYIGLELAEACILQKVPEIHIVEALDRLLNVFDPEFSEMVKTELEKNGVHIHLGERVMSFEGEDDKVTAVKTDKDCYAADVVILSIGVSPNTRFLPEGIEKLGNGALVTDASMKTSVPDVYAAGDCASVWSKLLDKPMYIALGTNANKQGRLAGDAVLGKNVRFARALGTSMLRVMGMEFAKTGLGEQECKANGIDYKTTTVESRSHARYYPDPVTLTVKLTYRAADKVLLGAQIAGAKEAAVRIDTFACAVDQGMTTDELGFLDLGYAPPFASVWDAIAIAANASK